MRKKSTKPPARLLAALLACLLLAACGAQPSPQPDPVPDSVPTEPSALTVVITGAQDTLDPAKVTAAGGESLLYHLFENLMRWTDGGDGWAVLSPGQAESYSVDTDFAGNATYTFTLREDARWSDGRPVTASHFAAAWRRLADPAQNLPHRELMRIVSGYEQVQETGDLSLLGVSAPDERTFVVSLQGSHAHFLAELCAGAWTMPVRDDLLSGGSWGDSADATVTNGAYTAAHLSRNLVTLKRSETYYDSAAAVPDEIRFVTREGSQADYDKLLAGEAALVTDLPQEPLRALADSGLWTPEPVTCAYGVLLNTRRPPFDDDNIRTAFRLAIDPQAVAEQLGDPTLRAAGGLIPYGVADYGTPSRPAEDAPAKETGALPDPSAASNAAPPPAEPDPVYWDFRAHSLEVVTGHTQRDYDADCLRAQALMAQAGYANGGGFPVVEYIYVDTGLAGELARVLQAMWQERLGVTVTVRGVSQEEYDALVLLQPLPEDVQTEGSAPQQVGALGVATGDFTLAGQTFSAPYSDAGALLERFCSASGDNVTGYASDAFDILLSSARAAVSPEPRDAYLHDAETILLEDAPVIPVCSLGGSFQLAQGYTGLYRAPDGVYFLFNVGMETPQ